MMIGFELLMYCVLVVGYGAMCYLAGKGDLLNLIPQILLQKAKEIEEQLKDGSKEDGS